MDDERVIPDQARELALAAVALAEQVTALQAELRARGVGWQFQIGRALDLAAGPARQVADALTAAADGLAQLGTIPDPGTVCGLPWGVCPKHGTTLVRGGRGTECRKCNRYWHYDRITAPCPEPHTHVVTEPDRRTFLEADRRTFLVCAGHAVAAREQIPGATVEPRPGATSGTSAGVGGVFLVPQEEIDLLG